jgi:hypothetical protein
MSSFIVRYAGSQFDVANFLDSHPAGADLIHPYKDKDITEVFNDIGHSKSAVKILNKYKISSDITTTEDIPAPAVAPPVVTIWTKLITKEDPFYFHKIFGLFSLCSFVYRYGYVYPTTGTLGFTGTHFDYFTLAAHWFLSSSSLIFHVLDKRIIERPLIIYEEYRLHAILFTTRAIMVSLYGILGFHNKWLLGGLLMSIHLLVDLATSLYGTKGVTAVRNNNDGEYKYIRMFYSYYQICAMGSHILVDKNLCDLGFNALIAIQSSTFLMTLKRKSIIRWKSHMFWYSFALLLSYNIMWQTKGPMFFVYMGIVFCVRIYNVNKYILWSTYAIASYSLCE